MFEGATIDSGLGLSTIQIPWVVRREHRKAVEVSKSTAMSKDVLGDTELLAKKEGAMASSEVEILTRTLETCHGFVLGKEMINASEEATKEFSEAWIARTRRRGGFSREMLEEALAGKGRMETAEFANEWKLLLSQASAPEYRIEMEEWSFVLRAEKAKRAFHFPYCSTAMSACNKIIQHYNRE